MKIAVIGLGYVGAVTAVCLARDGHEVIGIDVDRTKLDLLGRGQAPIVEEGLQEITTVAVNSGHLMLNNSIDHRIGDCELIFVCVSTPSAPNGSQSLTAVQRVAEQLGPMLREPSKFPVVVLRSTVPPGTTDTVVKPLLERSSGKKAGIDFGLCFQPEFLREGSSVKDYYSPPFTIVGSESVRAVGVLRELFGAFSGEFVHTEARSAEMLKLACNAFHALKVAFANEIGRLAQSLDVDSRAVMDLVCKDKSLNISAAYLRPGFAYGGSCLPKDLRALLHLAKRSDVEVPVMHGVCSSNALHIEHAASLVKAHGSRKVGMIGLSFKSGTDDLRESPLVTLAEHLIGKGYDLKIYDPAVSLARIIGANKRYIEQTIPHIGSLLLDNLTGTLVHSEVLIVGFKSREVIDALARWDKQGSRVVDLVGIDQQTPVRGDYVGICW